MLSLQSRTIYRRSWHYATISDCPHNRSGSRYVPHRSTIAIGMFIWWHIQTSPQRYCSRVKSSLLHGNDLFLSPLKRSPFDDAICIFLRRCHWKILILYIRCFKIFLHFEISDITQCEVLDFIPLPLSILNFWDFKITNSETHAFLKPHEYFETYRQIFLYTINIQYF